MKRAINLKRGLDFAFGTMACVVVTLLLGFILYHLS